MGVKLKKSKKPFMSVIKVTCNRYRTDNGCANFKMMQFPRTCTARAPFLYCAAIRTSVQALEGQSLSQSYLGLFSSGGSHHGISCYSEFKMFTNVYLTKIS